jgi:hypothetical protein
MKKLIIFLTLVYSVFIYSQVGIGVVSTEKTLDINGDLKIDVMADKSSDAQYNKILVANESGEIGAWTKDGIKDQIESVFLENKKVIVFSNTPDVNRTMECGRFEFRFNTGPEPQMRLSTAPTSLTTIYFSRIHKENSGANSFYGDNTVTTNISVDYDVANDWVSLDNSGRILNTLDEIYISYPGDNNLYRLTLLPRTMQTTPATQYFYTMMCEKF